MSKYKITVKKNGVGVKATLWCKFLFFYIPDTIIQCVDWGINQNNDYVYHIAKWKEDFDIPDERVIFKFKNNENDN